MRILHIEDDPIMVEMFRGILAEGLDEYGFGECIVDAVETGEEGLERLSSGAYDLLVTDLMLPGISGLDVLRRCKAERPELEVIVITASNSVRSAVEAMRMGARDYIEKPVDGTLLLEKISNVCDYLSRDAELSDVREAKDVVERHAEHEVRVLEARVFELRRKIDEAVSILREIDDSKGRIAEVIDLLSPRADRRGTEPSGTD